MPYNPGFMCGFGLTGSAWTCDGVPLSAIAAAVERRTAAVQAEYTAKLRERDADLRRGETNTGGRIHRLDHVVDQGLQVRSEVVDRFRVDMERVGAVAQNRTEHQMW